MEQCNRGPGQGKLYVVGIGPGSANQRTLAAIDAIKQAEIIVGYTMYVDLVADLVQGKEVDCSGMRDEKKRVKRAIDYTISGKNVALISSGDPGIYGMAGLVFELCRKYNFDIAVEVIPGVTAANAAASIVGAPLSCDFCVLSLSDLLVPKEQILKRAQGVAQADFVTVLYNPVSKKRKELIFEIQKIFLETHKDDTPVAIARNALRADEAVLITRLDSFAEQVLDMVTTVIIGNSQTKQWNDILINPRGYQL